jgi:hypothetical protein
MACYMAYKSKHFEKKSFASLYYFRNTSEITLSTHETKNRTFYLTKYRYSILRVPIEKIM